MNGLWMLPLGVGAAAAVAVAVVTRRLARELEGLGQAMRPLRSEPQPRRSEGPSY